MSKQEDSSAQVEDYLKRLSTTIDEFNDPSMEMIEWFTKSNLESCESEAK